MSLPPKRRESPLEVLSRRKTRAIFAPLAVFAMALGIILFAPRTYESEARLFLQIGRESVGIDPTAQTGTQMINLQQQGRDTEVTSAIDLLSSRGVIAKTVDRIGADYVNRGGPAGTGEPSLFGRAVSAIVYPAIAMLKSIDPVSPREEAMIEIEDNLGVHAERDSSVIQLTYAADSPVGAQKILETLIDVYREEHLRVHRNTDSRSFFQDQEGLLRSQLDDAMDAVRRVKDETGVASIAARRDNLEAQRQSIQMAAYEAESERSAAAAQLTDLRRQLASLPERLIASKKEIPNEGADLLREQLYALQVRQMDLKARYAESHPLMVAIAEQVAAAEKVVESQSTVRQETTDDVNPIHRELSLALKQQESVVAGIEARLAKLAEQEERVRADIAAINASEMRLAKLERDEAVLKSKYLRYADNLEQARIDDALQESEVSSVCVAQEPTLSEKPVSPSKLLVALGSIVLAFAATWLAVFGLEPVRVTQSSPPAAAAPVPTESGVRNGVLAS